MKVSEKRRARAARHVRAWQASGQSRSTYCAAHGIKVNTLDYWRRREAASPLRDRGVHAPKPTLIPVTVAATAPSTSGVAGMRVDVGAVRIQLPDGIAASWLSELVRGLLAC